MAVLHQDEQYVAGRMRVIEQRLEEPKHTRRQAGIDVEVAQKVMGYEIDKKEADELQDLF
jgi:hypothetical protein